MAIDNGSRWPSMTAKFIKPVLWGIWFVTWIGLLAGLYDSVFYQYVVIFSAAHALFVLILLRFNFSAFPAQVRVAYFLWVAVGTFMPYMTILMIITTVGLATNLFVGYCPLARLLYLLPWNRTEAFSMDLVMNVFLTPPVAGQFKPRSSAI